MAAANTLCSKEYEAAAPSDYVIVSFRSLLEQIARALDDEVTGKIGRYSFDELLNWKSKLLLRPGTGPRGLDPLAVK